MMRIRVFVGFIILILSACTPGELEPGSAGVPITRQSSATTTSIPTAEFAVDESATAAMSLTLVATSFPTPPEPPLLITPTPTPYETLEPRPTSTPAPPFPGFRYETAAGVWQVNAGWQPELLTNRTGLVISPDQSQAIYLEAGDIWLLDIASGESRNLTESSGRTHCCLQWPPARPDQILFGSWPTENYGPSSGYLSAVQPDGSGYTVLSEGQSNALPAISPDGQRIAYDLGDTAWIYDYATGSSTQLNPADYGLENVRRIGGPSWSPDGVRIAWTVAVTNPDWRIAVAVFNFETNSVELFHEYENIGRGGWFPGPAWHPEGNWLAFVAEDVDPERHGVWVVNVVSGEEYFIGQGQNPIWSPDGHWLAYAGFNEIDPNETRPWLVEFGSWYHVNLWIPDGGQLLEWVLPG